MKPNKNMSKVYRDVIAQIAAPTEELTHQQTVCRLYKASLKTLDSWTMDRRLWNEEATKIRQEFNQHMHLPPDSGLAKRLLREAQEKLTKHTHPDRYVFNYMPGGTLFMRNAPIPLDVAYPDGIPEGEELPPPEVNIDMTPLPVRKGVVVDFSKKGYD